MEDSGFQSVQAEKSLEESEFKKCFLCKQTNSYPDSCVGKTLYGAKNDSRSPIRILVPHLGIKKNTGIVELIRVQQGLGL